MRKFLIFLFLGFVFSCNEKEEVLQALSGDAETMEKLHYMDFGKGFSKAIEDPHFIDYIKVKAKEKIDHDYDVLYSLVSNENVNGKSFSEYIFNKDVVKRYFLDKNLTSSLITEKYPLLNIYVHNIDKLDSISSGVKPSVYVVLDKYKMFERIDGDKSYSLSETEIKEIPEGVAFVIGVNERFEAKEFGYVSPFYKGNNIFYANGYKFSLKNFLIPNSENTSFAPNTSPLFRSGNSNMFVLEYSRFQDLNTYTNVEGWYNGNPEMIIYYSLAYLNSNDEIKFNSHSISLNSAYVERRGFWRKRHLITAYNNIDVFSDVVIKDKNYNNTAVVLHVVEDDGEGTPLKIDVDVDLKVAKGKVSYHPVLGGRNSDLGNVTLSLQDLLNFGEVNVGGFIMKHKIR